MAYKNFKILIKSATESCATWSKFYGLWKKIFLIPQRITDNKN